MSSKQDEFKKVRDEIRKNKEDDRILKKRILEEIKSDRELFALRRGNVHEPVTEAVVVPKNVECVTIQVRTLDGSRLILNLHGEDTLSKLREEVGIQLGSKMEDILLIQSFPRKVFDEDSMTSTLQSLGLFPKASLTLEKKTAIENAFRPRQLSPGEARGLHSDEPGEEGSDEEEDEDRDEGHDDDEGLVNNDDDDNNDDEEHDEEEHFGFPVDEGVVPPQIGNVAGRPTIYFRGEGHKAARIVFGQPDLTYLDRNRNDLTVEAVTRRLAIQQQQQQHHERAKELRELNDARKQIRISVQNTSILSLKDLSVHSLARTVLGARPPRGVGGMPPSLATDVIYFLMKQDLLRPIHLRYFAGCRIQRLVLDNYKYCTNEILHALRRHNSLTRISLKNCSMVTDEGLMHLSNLKNLKSLNLCGCSNITNRSIPVIAGFKDIEMLDLGQTCVTDAGVKLLCEVRFPKLAILNLKGTSVSQKAIQSLSLLQNLKQLNLEACQLYDIEGIEKVKTLTDLNLSNTLISTEAVSRLQGLSQLKSLKLSNMPDVSCNRALLFLSGLKLKDISLPNQATLTDRGVQYLSNMPLAVLDLSRCTNITDDAMQHVGKMKTLNRLILTNTKITDKGLRQLHGLKDLKELNLNRCQITDDCADVFPSLVRLCDLSLSMTSITDNFIEKNTLKHCRYLKKLNISNTQVTEKGIEILKVPSLKVLNINETFIDPDALPAIPGCAALTKIVCETKRPRPMET